MLKKKVVKIMFDFTVSLNLNFYVNPKLTKPKMTHMSFGSIPLTIL